MYEKGGHVLNREFDQKEIERILKEDTQIPASVEQRIDDTCRRITTGITEGYAGSVPDTHPRLTRRRKRKAWTAVAAAAAVTAGLGLTAFAAVRLLSVQLETTDEGMQYNISVQPDSTGTAHTISASPTYVPDGYVCQEEGPYDGKWHNDATDGELTVITYNAAELYAISETQPDTLHSMFDSSSFVETTDISGMRADMFSEESKYTDDDTVIQNAFLFNEEFGYAVHIFLDGKDLPEDEALNVLRGLDITVLNETVPYPSDEELEQIRADLENGQPYLAETIDDSWFYGIGDEITPPEPAAYAESGLDADIEPETVSYKVTDIQVMDSLPLDEYPKENYIPDYDTILAPLLNEDGTLSPHDRYLETSEGIQEDEISTVRSKFIVATAEITNTGDTASEFYIEPALELLSDSGNGHYSPYYCRPTTSAYTQAVSTEGLPLYQSVQQFTDNGKQHVGFAELQPGETLKCTFAWAVDEDCVDDAYLAFFNYYGGIANLYPRIKI